MTSDVNLHDIAPRLAKARDQELERRRAIRRGFKSATEAMAEMTKAFERMGASAAKVGEQFIKTWGG